MNESIGSDTPPGLRSERLAQLTRRAVDRTGLNLSGRRVLTEAATGAYVVTPVLAALAGAEEVLAVTRSTRFGTVAEVEAQTYRLAAELGVVDPISVVVDRAPDAALGRMDIVTNSGHVRPIDAHVAGLLPPTAVVPLMFEAWELDVARLDVDVGALRERGIRTAGTNERHPAVDTFSYLGSMAVKLLADAAISAYEANILLICDNPFLPYLVSGLTGIGAAVTARDHLDIDDLDERVDAIVVSLTPTGEPVLTEEEINTIAVRSPGAVLAQFWGDVPRSWCEDRGVPCVPANDPGAGHMGVLPSAVGPEPIVRLQAGGLKVGELLLRDESTWTEDDRRYVDEL